MLNTGEKFSTPQKNRVFKYFIVFGRMLPVRTMHDGAMIDAIC